nr:unnamed protein product [Callosobruchus chinensis]
MPYTCLVVGCGSRSNREKLGFYSVPAITWHRFLTDKNELSRKRRALWIAAIKRDVCACVWVCVCAVCSIKFDLGKPADLENENHPDWVPSQNMGHTAQNVLKRQEDVERKERLEKRRKLHNPEVSVNEEN